MPKKNDERRNETPQIGDPTLVEVECFMKRDMILIPKPHSNFIQIQCDQCDEKRIVFSHATVDIYCKKCGAMLARRTASKAEILGKVISNLD
ncbi:MAG TPA: 30S ribosomal protein S27e [Nitrososphaeraceae archaeon]|nr:30S ribosomal protein S27e [Nitrososphaeraceae archaeon]